MIFLKKYRMKINIFKAIHPHFLFTLLFEKVLCDSFLMCFFLYFLKKYYIGLEMIQEFSGHEPYIQTLQKTLNWNKRNLEDHNVSLQWEIVLGRFLDFFEYVNEVVSG